MIAPAQPLDSSASAAPRRVGGVLETVLYGDDLPAMEAFYTTLLGLEPIARTPGRNVVLRSGASVVLLFHRGASREPGRLFPPHGTSGSGHIAFVISNDDLMCWKDHLEGAGIAIEREVLWPEGGFSIYFRDPAGNSVELAPATLWGGLGQRVLAASHPTCG